MAVKVKSCGGGGLSSSDVTASSNQVLSGYSTLTTDSNDEVMAGAVLTYTWDITTVPKFKIVSGGTATDARVYTYTSAQESTLKADLITAGYPQSDVESAIFADIRGTILGTVILDLTDCGAAGDLIKLLHKKTSTGNWEILYTGEIPADYQVTVTMTEFSPVVKLKSKLPYLCFTANTAGSTVKCGRDYEYSSNGKDWLTASTSSPITLTNVGDFIYVRLGSLSVSSTGTFTMTGSVAASGNAMSLVDNSCTSISIPVSYCFSNLFNGCTSLTTAPELPATSLTQGCYYQMFYGCTNLHTPPKLPATVLASKCYQMMFAVSGLTTPPKLPATTLASSCYAATFAGCTSLPVYTTSGGGHATEWGIPHLGNTVNSTDAMTNMFYNCQGMRERDCSPTFSYNRYIYYTQNDPV